MERTSVILHSITSVESLKDVLHKLAQVCREREFETVVLDNIASRESHSVVEEVSPTLFIRRILIQPASIPYKFNQGSYPFSLINNSTKRLAIHCSQRYSIQQLVNALDQAARMGDYSLKERARKTSVREGAGWGFQPSQSHEASGIHVLRMGGSRGAARYLDLVANDRIGRLTVVSSTPDLVWAQVENAAIRFGLEKYLSKINLQVEPKVKKRSPIQRYIEAVPTILRHEQDVDLIWLGDSDGDMPCYWAAALDECRVDIPRVLTYKETRFVKDYVELRALKSVSACVFPNEHYVPFFKRLYGLDLKNVRMGDPNWPLDAALKHAKKNRAGKLSSVDGKVRVCVLAGKLRDLAGSAERRSGARYYIVDDLKALAKSGYEVHIHALQRTGDALPSEYLEICKVFSNVHFHPPLMLSPGSPDYDILGRYDYGFMHPPVDPSFQDLHEFQKINFPNRYYEYLMCGVRPLVQRGALPAVEAQLEGRGTGIVFRDYDELRQRIAIEAENPGGGVLADPAGELESYKQFVDSMLTAAGVGP